MATNKSRKLKTRTAAIRVRVKPSVKAMAERLAQKDGRSIADWLERLIAAEKATQQEAMSDSRRSTAEADRLSEIACGLADCKSG
jgi:hypothetical protein